MKRFLFILIIVSLTIAVTINNPVFAQDITPPEGDGWVCLPFEGAVEIGVVTILREETPPIQLWIDGEVFYNDILEEESTSYMILGLGTSELRIKKEQGSPMNILCLYEMPAETATPIATATLVATETPATIPTATPATVVALVATETSVATATTEPIGPIVYLVVIGILIIIVILVLSIVMKKKKN